MQEVKNLKKILWIVERKLETVNKKHSEVEKRKNPQTVCKHFLEAFENNKYGWLWVCPREDDTCMHHCAFPPGFVLKKYKEGRERK